MGLTLIFKLRTNLGVASFLCEENRDQCILGVSVRNSPNRPPFLIAISSLLCGSSLPLLHKFFEPLSEPLPGNPALSNTPESAVFSNTLPKGAERLPSERSTVGKAQPQRAVACLHPLALK